MSKNLFIFEENNLFGFKDILGKKIIKANYDEVTEFCSEYAFVKKNSKWSLIDVNEKIIIESCDSIVHFDKNEMVYKKDGKYFHCLDFNFPTTKQTSFAIKNYSNGIFLIESKKKFFYIDSNFKKINNMEYDDAHNFNDHFAPVCLNDKWGVINKNGVLVIDFKYDYMWPFSGYLFKVKLNNNEFFIDLKEGKYLQDLNKKNIKFDNIFSDNFLVIKKDNKFGIMDEFFEIYFLRKMEGLQKYKDNIAVYEKNNKFGLINKNGKFITKAIYDNIFYRTDDYYFLKFQNKYNYYCLKSKKLLFV